METINYKGKDPTTIDLAGLLQPRVSVGIDNLIQVGFNRNLKSTWREVVKAREALAGTYTRRITNRNRGVDDLRIYLRQGVTVAAGVDYLSQAFSLAASSGSYDPVDFSAVKANLEAQQPTFLHPIGVSINEPVPEGWFASRERLDDLTTISVYNEAANAIVANQGEASPFTPAEFEFMTAFLVQKVMTEETMPHAAQQKQMIASTLSRGGAIMDTGGLAILLNTTENVLATHGLIAELMQLSRSSLDNTYNVKNVLGTQNRDAGFSIELAISNYLAEMTRALIESEGPKHNSARRFYEVMSTYGQTVPANFWDMAFAIGIINSEADKDGLDVTAYLRSLLRLAESTGDKFYRRIVDTAVTTLESSFDMRYLRLESLYADLELQDTEWDTEDTLIANLIQMGSLPNPPAELKFRQPKSSTKIFGQGSPVDEMEIYFDYENSLASVEVKVGGKLRLAPGIDLARVHNMGLRDRKKGFVFVIQVEQGKCKITPHTIDEQELSSEVAGSLITLVNRELATRLEQLRVESLSTIKPKTATQVPVMPRRWKNRIAQTVAEEVATDIADTRYMPRIDFDNLALDIPPDVRQKLTEYSEGGTEWEMMKGVLRDGSKRKILQITYGEKRIWLLVSADRQTAEYYGTCTAGIAHKKSGGLLK